MIKLWKTLRLFVFRTFQNKEEYANKFRCNITNSVYADL